MASGLQAMEIPIPVDGVVPDVDPRQLPPTALVDARNFVIRDGVMYVRPGLTSRFMDSGGAAVARDGTGVFFIYGDEKGATGDAVIATALDRIYRGGGTNVATGTLSGTAPCVFRVFDRGGSRWVLIANGTNPVQKWEDDAATFANVGTGDGDGPDDADDEPGKAQCIMVLATRLLACGFPDQTGAGALVRVSNALDFDTGWNDPQQEVSLTDTQGNIVAAMEMGTLRGAIYKDTSIWIVTAGSDSLAPFTFELAHDNIVGPVSRESVCIGPSGEHYYLAQDGGLYVFDGNRSREFSPRFKTISRSILDASTTSGVTRTPFITYDARHNELVCGIGWNEDATIQWIARVRLDNGSVWPQEYTVPSGTPQKFMGACFNPVTLSVAYAVPDAAAATEATYLGGSHAFGHGSSTFFGYRNGSWDFDLDADLVPSSHLSALAITAYARWGILRPDPSGTSMWTANEAEMEWVSNTGALGNPTATVGIAGASHYAWRDQSGGAQKILINVGHAESTMTNITLTGVTPDRAGSYSFGMRETGRFFMVKLDAVTNPVDGGSNSTVGADFSFRGGRVYLKQRGKR